MRIILESQTVMADVVGGIMSPGHGAQGHHHYGLLLGTALDAAQEVVDALGYVLALDFLDFDSLRELFRLFFLTVLLCPGLSREIVAEEANELAEYSELLLVGILVYAVNYSATERLASSMNSSMSQLASLDIFS